MTVKKIAGVKTPILEDVIFKIKEFSLFNKPSWFMNGIEILGFAIYPNPVSDFIYISYKSLGKMRIEIYNTEGQKVLNKEIDSSNPGNQDIELDIEGLPQGLYIINLESENNQSSQKFIKK